MKKYCVLLILTCLLLGACAPQTPAEPAQATAEAQPQTEMPAPPEAVTEPDTAPETMLGSFSFTALDGTVVDNAYFAANKLTMVNYWATWCGFCVMEMPDIQRLADDYADKGFGVVGVFIWDEDTEGAQAFLQEKKISYPSIVAAGPFEALAGDFTGIPTTVFFDGEGNPVGETVVGFRDYAGWATLVDQLLESVS